MWFKAPRNSLFLPVFLRPFFWSGSTLRRECRFRDLIFCRSSSWKSFLESASLWMALLESECRFSDLNFCSTSSWKKAFGKCKLMDLLESDCRFSDQFFVQRWAFLFRVFCPSKCTLEGEPPIRGLFELSVLCGVWCLR